jgi:hypothetical protein
MSQVPDERERECIEALFRAEVESNQEPSVDQCGK